MANVSDKLASMACAFGILYVTLTIAAAQSPGTPATPTFTFDKGVVVSLFPYPYPGHVELFEGIDPKEMTGASSSTQHPFPQENILITKLVPDPSRNVMYYIDVYTNSIYRWENVTTTLNDQTVSTINQTVKVFEGLSRAICKLDIDYVANNIYWSDPLLHWIGMKPAYSTDPADTKILVTDDVDYVAALAVDSESKYLFWFSSAYDDGKLERSNLLADPDSREVILKTSIGFVDDMALDMIEKRLYWVDSYRMTIESVSYTGTGRRILRRLVGLEFTSIAVIESNICLINYNSYEMQCMYKASGDRYAYHSFYPSNPYAVGFFNEGVQKKSVENKCATISCDHLCVNTNTQAMCVCGDGYTLDSDRQTCTETTPLFDNSLLMTNTSHICTIKISSLSSTANYKPTRCLATNVTKDTTHIQADVAKSLVYYMAKSTEPTTINKTQLLQFNLITQSHTIVLPDMEEADDMAYDWVGEKMFTCHSKLNLIKAWDVVTGRSSVIYSGTEVTKVFELAIDPHRDNLYWIAATTGGFAIFVGTFSGTTPVQLLGSGSLTKPSGISYEYLDDTVCFIDSGRFASVNLNGTIVNHRISVGSATKSLIYKNYAIWNSGPATLKMSLFSLDATIYTTVTSMGKINAIALYSAESQKSFLDPCKIGNGGCDDLCFRKDATVSCYCDFGRTLQSDGKSCRAVPLENNFMLVTDLSHDRIMQIASNGSTIISLPIPNLMTPAMARYNHKDNLLYWCEVGSKDIKRGNLDGTNIEKMITIGGESYPDRFAIDFTTNHVYYTVAHTQSPNAAYIAVMVPKADQTDTKRLIEDLNYVGGIVLHPGKGYMYFNNHAGAGVYIARAYMDGTNVEKKVALTNGQPLGMTIDYQNEMLYWTDAYTDQDKIEYINLEFATSSRGVLVNHMTSDVVDLTISAGFLYYVGYNVQQVIKMNINNKQRQNFMTHQADFGVLDSVDIVPTQNTQPVNTQCETMNGMCSHYCFSTPKGKRCGCPDGLYLDQTTKLTCTSAPPTCPMQIPNGQLNPGCTARVDTSCGYSCNGSNFIKNPAVTILNCTSSLFWNVPTDTLCVEKVCQTDMPNGQLVSCSGKANEACGWTCRNPYIKRPLIEAVVCLSTGQWSTSLDKLCVPKVLCPIAIPNGNLPSCTYEAGSSCTVSCDNNYSSVVDNIHCLPDGVWDVNIQTLCKMKTVTKCPANIPNGQFQLCSYMADRSCRIACNSGYSSSVDFVHCLPDGIWDKDPKNICEVTKVVSPEKQTAASAADSGLIAAVAVVVTLLVILIVLGAAFYFLRRRIFSPDKQNVQGRYRSSPNVYFNASDSRGAAASPTEGFTNPSLHAGNGDAMPNTDPLKMDQINLSDDTNKQNMQNEGHYDMIKEGRQAGGAGAHEAVNPLYTTMQPREEMPYKNAENLPEKPGYQRFN